MKERKVLEKALFTPVAPFGWDFMNHKGDSPGLG